MAKKKNLSQTKYAREWEKNARLDPLFAILSSSHGGSGNWNLQQFFATGRTEIDRVFSYLGEFGVVPRSTGCFLDFGCGVGRVSQALALRFVSGFGIDISARMIELARRYNQKDYPIEFIRNTEPELRMIPSSSISFVYSHIVLQHISNHLQRRFISEFTRVLEPGGVAFFQIPIEKLGPSRAAVPVPWLQRQVPQPMKDGLKKILGMRTQADIVTMEMNALPGEEITDIIQGAGCTVARLSYSNSTERNHNGLVEFFDRPDAEARIARRDGQSPFLSACYTVIQRAVG